MLFKTSQFIGKYSQSPVLCLQLLLDCQSFREEAEISVFPPPWEPSMKPIWRLSPATVPMGSGLTDHPKKKQSFWVHLPQPLSCQIQHWKWLCHQGYWEEACNLGIGRGPRRVQRSIHRDVQILAHEFFETRACVSLFSDIPPPNSIPSTQKASKKYVIP